VVNFSTLPASHGASEDVETKKDEDEWQTVISAFELYKSAFGDLKVPSRFIVPSMEPWPEQAWGMKLGLRVAGIRSTGRFVANDESRRSKLDEMGFIWRLRSTSTADDDTTFEQIFDALKCYKEEFGNLDVQQSFIVPNAEPWKISTRGLPLGSKISLVRSKTYLRDNPNAESSLRSIGFEFDGKAAANNQRFKLVYDALCAYKEANGDLLVPQPFIIPEGDDSYPKHTWGLRLGARVNAIRSQGTFVKTDPSRKGMLDDIGFAWEPPPSLSGKKRGRKRKEDIEDSKPEESNLTLGDLANYSPVVNQQSPTWGTGSSPLDGVEGGAGMGPPDPDSELAIMEREMALANSDSVWEFDDFNGYDFEDVVEAMTIYNDATGDWDIDRRLVCGEPLTLEEDTDTIIDVVEGSEAAMGELPAESAVEDDDSVVANLIAAIEQDDDVFLGDLEGDDDEDDDDDEGLEELMEQLSMLEDEGTAGLGDNLGGDIGGEENLEVEEVVGEESTKTVLNLDFPSNLHGMKLGEICHRIRTGDVPVGHDPERRAVLDSIKFDWGDTSKYINAPFARVLAALYAYKKIRGDCCVEQDFKVPEYDPWPAVLGGFELGHYVNEIRGQKQLLEEEFPLKMMMLNQLGFLWLSKLS